MVVTSMKRWKKTLKTKKDGYIHEYFIDDSDMPVAMIAAVGKDTYRYAVYPIRRAINVKLPLSSVKKLIEEDIGDSTMDDLFSKGQMMAMEDVKFEKPKKGSPPLAAAAGIAVGLAIFTVILGVCIS